MTISAYQLAAHRQLIIIINAIKPYGYELNNILASPSGQHYRCRYRKDWVALDVPPPTLIGYSGLIAVRVFHDGRLIPAREIIVDSVRQIGDILYIEYQLKDIVPLSEASVERASQIADFNAHVASITSGVPNIPGQDFSSLILTAPSFSPLFSTWRESSDSCRDADSCWGNVVEELQNIPLFNDVDFLRVVGLTDQSGRAAATDSSGRYQLINGNLYALEVLQRTNAGAIGDSGVGSSRNLLVVLDKSVFRPLRDTLPVTGRYDLFRFEFRAASGSLPAVSSILLRVTPTERWLPGGPTEDLSLGNRIGPIPDVLLSVIVDRTRRQWASLIIRLVLASALLTLYFVPGVIVDRFMTTKDTLLLPGHTQTVQAQWETTVSQVALILFVLLSSGSLPAAFRAFSVRSDSP